MKDLWHFWALMFFTPPIAIFVAIIGFIISLKNKSRKFKYFPFYFALYLITNFSIVGPLISNRHTRTSSIITDYLDHSFTFLEFFIFFHYMKSNTQNIFVRKSYKYLMILFSVIFFYASFHDIVLFKKVTKETKNITYTIEGLVLIVPCMFFLKKYFIGATETIMLKDPDFWIITGFLFAIVCTLPYSFLENYILHQYHNLYPTTYSIFYVFYILLFLMIIKGMLCKPLKLQ
jgi:hypothetical protein